MIGGLWLSSQETGKFFQKINYEGIGSLCSSCGLSGHGAASCNVVENAHGAGINISKPDGLDGWTLVTPKWQLPFQNGQSYLPPKDRYFLRKKAPVGGRLKPQSDLSYDEDAVPPVDTLPPPERLNPVDDAVPKELPIGQNLASNSTQLQHPDTQKLLQNGPGSLNSMPSSSLQSLAPSTQDKKCTIPTSCDVQELLLSNLAGLAPSPVLISMSLYPFPSTSSCCAS